MLVQMDWNAMLLGLAVGIPVSVLFFVGLAWGMRLALRSHRPGSVLLVSAVCRIAVLLAIGFWITTSRPNAWPLVGYALAFLLVRMAAIFRARLAPMATPPKQGDASCR